MGMSCGDKIDVVYKTDYKDPPSMFDWPSDFTI